MKEVVQSSISLAGVGDAVSEAAVAVVVQNVISEIMGVPSDDVNIISINGNGRLLADMDVQFEIAYDDAEAASAAVPP